MILLNDLADIIGFGVSGVSGTKMTFKKNGSPTKEDILFDADIVFRVTKDDTFEVLVDDSSVVKFSFTGATFEPQAKTKARAKK